MERESLLKLRQEVFAEYSDRVKLGEFDANSKSISVCLHAIVELITHLLQEQANVHRAAKSATAKVSTGRSS